MTRRSILSLITLPALLRAQTGTRRALLIANGQYAHLPPVKIDQNLIILQSALETAGFTTAVKQNLSADDMIAAQTAFLDTISEGDVCFFYFQGHAGQDRDEQNFLLPIDFAPEGTEPLVTSAIPLLRLPRLLEEKKPGLQMTVVEEALTDPRLRKRFPMPGLAAPFDPPVHSFFAFSSYLDHDQTMVITHSPDLFTRELAAVIAQPGLGLNRLAGELTQRVATASQRAQKPFVRLNEVAADFVFTTAPSEPLTPPRRPDPVVTVGTAGLAPEPEPAAETKRSPLPAIVAEVEYVRPRPLFRFTGQAKPIRSVAFRPDGTLLAGAGLDRNIYLWTPADGKPSATWKGHRDAVLSVAFSPDGTRLVSSSSDRTVQLWDVPDGKRLEPLVGHKDKVAAVAFRPDGKVVASAGFDKQVLLWDAASGKLLAPLHRHRDVVSCVVFSPDGKLLASGGFDKKLHLWNAADGVYLRTLQKQDETVQSLAFSPDSRFIAVTGPRHTVQMFDVASGRRVLNLAGHANPVRALAFTRDGSMLASASFDKTMRLWDPVSGALLGVLSEHKDDVGSLAFSPDGRMLASASFDNTVLLWSLYGKA